MAINKIQRGNSCYLDFILKLFNEGVNGMPNRAVWVEVDLAAIEHNIREIKKKVHGGAKFCAVIKANAYGHGVVPVARTAIAAGAD